MPKYFEKKVSAIFSRRDFLKVAGIGVSVVAISGYVLTDVIKRRKSYICMRQAGLYKDDERLQKANLSASHQNPSVIKAYEDLGTKPMGEIAEELLHTNAYFDRTNLKLGAKHA